LLIDAHVQQTAVTDLNVYHVIELILGRRWITVRDIASKTCVSVDSYSWALIF
jgi:hypothetical protein